MTDEEFVAWNERMAKEYDPDLYHRSSNPIVRWVEGRRVKRLLKLLGATQEHSVLEVGVGAGNILERIPGKKTGIDISEFLLEKAKQKLGTNAELLLGDAEALELLLGERKFDRIYCSEVLEHVRSPHRVLQGMAACLEDDGVAVVSVPNESFINFVKRCLKSVGVFRLLFPDMADHMEDEWHVHEFGRSLLVSLASEHFIVEQIDAVPSALLPIRLVAKLRPKNLVSSSLHHDEIFKNFFKRWPWFYNACFAIIGPSLLTGMTSKRFVRTLPKDARILNAGSGPRVLDERCVNVDMFPFPGVSVVADLHALPFGDASFDAVTSEQVLEHVEKPYAVASELLRVVKPGGLIHIASPFLFPWHPSPSDYSRWTQEGLRDLLPGCTLVKQGVMAGPFSALNAFLPAFLATVFCFGSQRLQSVLQYVFLILCIPIKCFDVLFAFLPGAELCAANFYLVVRKR